MSSRIQIALPAILSISLILVGCTPSSSLPTVSASSVGTVHTIDKGTIVDVQLVRIDGTTSGTSAIIGAGAGAGIGSAIAIDGGSGVIGTAIGGAAGAVVGSIAAQKLEKTLTSKTAQELTIRLDDGRVISVIQERREPEFNSGDNVVVHMGGYGAASVRYDDSGDVRDNPYITQLDD